MKYYIDSCIWLNLFKKEGDARKGVPYWKIAKNFVRHCIENKKQIIFSTIVVKEISFKLSESFRKIEKELGDISNSEIIKTCPEDYDLARKIEIDNNFEIGFYDCLHTVICRRIGAILVTRDRDLLKIGKKYVNILKPENLLG
jgi:predicted nucleic acid-binding protein